MAVEKRRRIAEIQTSAIRFLPGDKLIVRTQQKLGREQAEKLKRAITKWAGEDVDIIVLSKEIDLTLQRHGEPDQQL